jgi:hypothetical protein
MPNKPPKKPRKLPPPPGSPGRQPPKPVPRTVAGDRRQIPLPGILAPKQRK